MGFEKCIKDSFALIIIIHPMSIAQQDNTDQFYPEFPIDAENGGENVVIGCRKSRKKGVRMPLQDITNQVYPEFPLIDAENESENSGGQENVSVARDNALSKVW